MRRRRQASLSHSAVALQQSHWVSGTGGKSAVVLGGDRFLDTLRFMEWAFQIKPCGVSLGESSLRRVTEGEFNIGVSSFNHGLTMQKLGVHPAK